MFQKDSIKYILIFSLLINFVLVDNKGDILEIKYEEKKSLEQLQSTFFDTTPEGLYYLEELKLSKNHTIVAFSNMGGFYENEEGDKDSKMTGIITYELLDNNEIYKFYYNKFSSIKKNFIPYELFQIKVDKDYIFRNFYIGSLFDNTNRTYIVSFIDKNNKKDMKHYLIINDLEVKILKSSIGDNIIKSNILFLNKNDEFKNQIIFSENHKIKLCSIDEDGICENIKIIDDLNENYYISSEGGMAYVDITGNCVSDIILSIDNDTDRTINIYPVNRENIIDPNHKQNFTLQNKSEYGAFAVSVINRDENEDTDNEKTIPMLDIFIPSKINNSIFYYQNKRRIKDKGYEIYCGIDDAEFNYEKLFDTPKEIRLGENNNKIYSDKVTMIRFGDFLDSSNPGIIVSEQNNQNETIINYYELTTIKTFELHDSFIKSKISSDSEEKLETGLFYDIGESGYLSMIICSNKDNYFFFNRKNDIYFLKSKLMNQLNNEKAFFDANLGATFRYYVTNSKSERVMHLSTQMPQTSDMNIPLPYSYIGLNKISNYIENFNAISGNYLKDAKFDTDTEKNWIKYTPIIPDTQMMIFKYKNSEGKIKWEIDLIVQPTEYIILILIIIVLVLLIVLAIIIYLHVKEVREEQKEHNKFKSWFA